MTAPILTSITLEANRLEYYVRFFVSTKFNGRPPSPLPELNLQLGQWRTHCVAVRKFSGFARNDTISKEVQALVTSIGRLQTSYSAELLDKSSYTVAQYNASFHNVGRLNEVWMNATRITTGGCQSFQRLN
ncbi:hypothetical protein AQUCO_00200057v1 [Aquilegia coerulea]|uniref:Uncharacterized protein n=1 Tax=Aquilegia coerulea TaxID=218851 RepID=A0A2G5F195_AQUCA|nr:hypothetical protein AQUCO_00200057v1 [Aquilegia coerulea]